TDPARPAPALGLPGAGPANRTTDIGPPLGPQSRRCVPRLGPLPSGADAEPAGEQGSVAPPRLPGPDRSAADARGAARLPGRLFARRRRARGGPAARRPALRRALGPSLDGRVALQRLVRTGG